MAEVGTKLIEKERGTVYWGRAGDTRAARNIDAARYDQDFVELKAL